MAAAAPIAVSDTVTYQPPAAAVPASAEAGLTFREVLSDLNPLQYLPVVGTLYRAITGDAIPRPLREAGSLVVSGLMGGPIGIATNLTMLGFEKLTGIDLEQVEQNVITSLTQSQAALSTALLQSSAVEGAGGTAASAATAAAAPTPGLSAGQTAIAPWNPAQLAAYGVVQGPDGDLHQGTLRGADALNALQLRVTTAPGSAV